MIHRYSQYGRESHFDADVVVIGTGAGGATVGTELAEAGFDVLFVEEGSYHPPSSFNPFATESVPRLYRDVSATLMFGTPPIPYVEGRCVGGSTVINGGMTWRAPERVLDRWARITGDATLGPAGMDPLFQKVERAVHADYQSEVSFGEENRLMLEGARKMGWRVEINRRNQVSCVGTNNCAFGCPTGAKQSTLVSLLPRAFEAGARCLTEVRVERLLLQNGRCVGVAGRAIDPASQNRDKEILVHGRAVVVCCGAVQTPFLLLGQRRSRHLGKNFACHPNAKVLAFYPHEVRGWQGVSQWSQIREFHAEGIMMANNQVPPGGLAAYIPFHGRKAWDLMKRYNHMVASGVLVEDSTAGEVTRGPFHYPLVRYNITDHDHRRFLKGVRLLAEMHLAMGADAVLLPFTNLHFVRSMEDLTKIELTQKSKKTLELFTVHLMGSARMGSTARDSAVDLGGELWDLPGCYVADASIFPTPIGVNPQITIMALALRVAQRLAASLSRRCGTPTAILRA